TGPVRFVAVCRGRAGAVRLSRGYAPPVQGMGEISAGGSSVPGGVLGPRPVLPLGASRGVLSDVPGPPRGGRGAPDRSAGPVPVGSDRGDVVRPDCEHF